MLPSTMNEASHPVVEGAPDPSLPPYHLTGPGSRPPDSIACAQPNTLDARATGCGKGWGGGWPLFPTQASGYQHLSKHVRQGSPKKTRNWLEVWCPVRHGTKFPPKKRKLWKSGSCAALCVLEDHGVARGHATRRLAEYLRKEG